MNFYKGSINCNWIMIMTIQDSSNYKITYVNAVAVSFHSKSQNGAVNYCRLNFHIQKWENILITMVVNLLGRTMQVTPTSP